MKPHLSQIAEIVKSDPALHILCPVEEFRTILQEWGPALEDRPARFWFPEGTPASALPSGSFQGAILPGLTNDWLRSWSGPAAPPDGPGWVIARGTPIEGLKAVDDQPVNERPLVSVLVPWWKGEPWKEQLEATLTGQTYDRWEAIIMGDGETPPAFNDDRIRAFYQPHGGISAATNGAFDRSSGDLLMFLDQDDTLTPDCIAHLVRSLRENPAWGAVTARQHYVRPGLTEPDQKTGFNRTLQLRHQIAGHPILFRRECWVPHESAFDGAQDGAWGMRFNDLFPVGYLDEFLYDWHLHGENISLRRAGWQAGLFQEAAKKTKERRAANPSIALVLPSLGKSGGIRVVLELANHLQATGAPVCIVDTSGRYGNSLSASGGRPFSPGAGPAREKACVPIPGIPVWSAIPQTADLAIATSWDTPGTVLNHERSGNGLAGWLVQNWESDWSSGYVQDDPGIERVAVISPWLQDALRERWGRGSTLLRYGCDCDPLPDARPKPDRPSVMLAWRDHVSKSPERTLQLARAIRKELGWNVALVSPVGRPDDAELASFVIEGMGPLELKAVYDRHAFFCLAGGEEGATEGMSVMVTEAMARGCVPVVQEQGTDQVDETCGARLKAPAAISDFLAALEYAWQKWDDLSRESVVRARQFEWDNLLPSWQETFRGWVRA